MHSRVASSTPAWRKAGFDPLLHLAHDSVGQGVGAFGAHILRMGCLDVVPAPGDHIDADLFGDRPEPDREEMVGRGAGADRGRIHDGFPSVCGEAGDLRDGQIQIVEDHEVGEP